jgi:putative peptide zinc metalloprotease protein
MVVEVFIAAIALLLWLDAEPGIVRAVLYNVILIAGVSTVMFNANPLLRYDGYYILSDLTQIPNLRARANQYLSYVMETRLFGVKLPEFEAASGERPWFVFFSIASFIYRTFVVFAIAMFIATQYFVIGVVLALWAVFTSVVLPIFKGVSYVLMHPRLRRHRARAVLATASIVTICSVLFCLVPIPLWSRGEGVIWVPDDALVRAGTDGFVRKVMVVPGSTVTEGTPLVLADEPTLEPRIKVLQAQLQLLQTRAQAELQVDRVRWELTQEDIKSTRAQLDHAVRQSQELVIVSPTGGQFVLSGSANDWPDRFVRKGQQLGYVVPASTATARVLVSQDDVDMVRTRTTQVEVKLAGRMSESFKATIRRETPAASSKLSNLAMSSIGGGNAPVDPRETKEPKTLTPWFEFELEMPSTKAIVLGEHVYVRFDHGHEAIAWRLYRSARQLFMRRFAV